MNFQCLKHRMTFSLTGRACSGSARLRWRQFFTFRIYFQIIALAYNLYQIVRRFGASSMAPLPGKKGTMFFSRGSAVVAIIKDKDFIDAGCLRRGTSDVLALDRFQLPPA